jgi:hypothetical protein
MIKRSVLDQIVMLANGSVSLRFLKQVLDDDGTVFAEIPHRAVVQPWEACADVMAFADERLTLKHAPVSQSDKDWLSAVTESRKLIRKK